ncbi:pyroglutamyl-peptidase I [Pseudacidovorax sp. NFM-22]|uniref:pyroglutamyl-peptidase I n=1 Tax=Pseudacidovorax sp. NFM-22 TaxID=2744469 RepID=UPI001F290C1E|nr:pyroglutamyl-peptidase I [Pseudacidovorax sp. NFM-22]
MSTSLRRVLLTGFEPFGGDAFNPSWEVARALDREVLAPGVVVESACLPCVFGEAIASLDEHLGAGAPPLMVVALGLAGGRAGLTPERVAINIDDARIADNDGRQPVDRPVVPGAPAAYFSRLPIKAMVRALQAAGLPAAVSNTAGTFVCNHLFFALMHRLATRPALAGVRGGFVHLPWLPTQLAEHPGEPALALADQVAGVRLLLRTALRVDTDIVEGGGALH